MYHLLFLFFYSLFRVLRQACQLQFFVMTDKKWHQITTHIRVNCVHFVGLVFLAVPRWSQLLRRRALSTKWPQIRGDNTTHATLCSPSFSPWYLKKKSKIHILEYFQKLQHSKAFLT